MGKSKKETSEAEAVGNVTQESIKEEGLTYEEKLENVSIIAKPMAPRKLTKKIFKVIKKAGKQKSFLRNGLKDVQTRIRKGETGMVFFAGDVTPVEIMCHLPAVCEDKSIPYCYIPSRADLGQAMGVKRGSLMVLVREHSDYKELYDEIESEVKCLPHPM